MTSMQLHIQTKYKLPIETKTIDYSEFNKRLSESYSEQSQSSESLAENIHEDVDLDSLVLDLPKTEDLLDDSTDSPVIRLINAILSEAIKDGASDIHIEPYEETLLIRFRTDGILKEKIRPSSRIAPSKCPNKNYVQLGYCGKKNSSRRKNVLKLVKNG